MLGNKWPKPLSDTTFSTTNDILEVEPKKWIAETACLNLNLGFMVLYVFHYYYIVLSLSQLFMLLWIFLVQKSCAMSSPVIRDGVLSHLSTVPSSWFNEGRQWCTSCWHSQPRDLFLLLVGSSRLHCALFVGNGVLVLLIWYGCYCCHYVPVSHF